VFSLNRELLNMILVNEPSPRGGSVKASSELEGMILTTLYFVGVENTDTVVTTKGLAHGLQLTEVPPSHPHPQVVRGT
jgi:hypothetical protein